MFGERLRRHACSWLLVSSRECARLVPGNYDIPPRNMPVSKSRTTSTATTAVEGYIVAM